MRSTCTLVVLGNSNFVVVRAGRILFQSDKLHEVEEFLDNRENQQRVGLCQRFRKTKERSR